MRDGFRAQDTWLGCNGLITLVVATGAVLAVFIALSIAAARLIGRIELAATSARLTEARDA